MIRIYVMALICLISSLICSGSFALDLSDSAPDWEQQAFKKLNGFKDLDNGKARVPFNGDYLKAVRIESAKRFRKLKKNHDPNIAVTEAEITDNAMRCVRKNNYWCIKNKSKWPGVIGEDREGHAVF